MSNIKVVAFDADDTLWHNEPIFLSTRDRFVALLERYQDAASIEARLNDTEMRNLRHFGYGVKSFTLSMIETATELTENRISAAEISKIVSLGKEMIRHPVELLPEVESTIRGMAEGYRLMIVTKGELFHQESKIARSGLGDFFANVEVLAEKDVSVYRRLLDKYELAPTEFVMIGNSLRSDIIPICEMGGHAIFVPYETTWEHENVADEVVRRHQFTTAGGIGEVPNVVAALNGSTV